MPARTCGVAPVVAPMAGLHLDVAVRAQSARSPRAVRAPSLFAAPDATIYGYAGGMCSRPINDAPLPDVH